VWQTHVSTDGNIIKVLIHKWHSPILNNVNKSATDYVPVQDNCFSLQSLGCNFDNRLNQLKSYDDDGFMLKISFIGMFRRQIFDLGFKLKRADVLLDRGLR
jgi:hypothetical protein